MRTLSKQAKWTIFPAFIAVAVAFSGACSKKEQPMVLHPMMPTVGELEASVVPNQHGSGQGRIGETAVYVDGKPVAVLRALELPPGMTPSAAKSFDGMDVPRYYRLYDYVKALGVDVDRVTMIHLYGSHERVAQIGGDELKKFRDRLVFDFTAQTRGKARCRWNSRGLREGAHIDTISTMLVYVDKVAPTYDPVEGTLELAGQVVEGIPYGSDLSNPKGTRIYVDGRLVGWVKRRSLGDKLIAPGSEKKNTHFALSAYLDSLGVDWKSARAVDFVAGDDLAARLDGKKLDDGTEYFFTIPQHSKGKVLSHFPGEQSAKVTAVELFIKTAPPARQVDPEVMDTGSDEPQGEGQNGQGNGSAQTVNGNQASDDD